jgi:hypothetical protein
MRTVKFEGRTVRLNEHHTFAVDQGEFGIQVRVNERWWMPPKPFPPGFDQAQAEFDTVENAVKALRLVFDIEVFVWLDEDGDVLEMENPRTFIRHMNDLLGIDLIRRQKPRRRAPRRTVCA